MAFILRDEALIFKLTRNIMLSNENFTLIWTLVNTLRQNYKDKKKKDIPVVCKEGGNVAELLRLTEIFSAKRCGLIWYIHVTLAAI